MIKSAYIEKQLYGKKICLSLFFNTSGVDD